MCLKIPNESLMCGMGIVIDFCRFQWSTADYGGKLLTLLIIESSKEVFKTFLEIEGDLDTFRLAEK